MMLTTCNPAGAQGGELRARRAGPGERESRAVAVAPEPGRHPRGIRRGAPLQVPLGCIAGIPMVNPALLLFDVNRRQLGCLGHA